MKEDAAIRRGSKKNSMIQRQSTERKQKRQAEIEDSKSATADLYLAPLDTKDYSALAQNLVQEDRIPEGTGHLNRYINILPNPRTRVRLTEVDDDETTRFINANFIQAHDGTARRYIAAQGPLPETVESFWRMIWEKNVKSIIMVTGLVEKGMEKCARYWPVSLT